MSHACADDIEEPIAVGAGQEDRRLVEDQKPAVTATALGCVFGQGVQRADDGQQGAVQSRKCVHLPPRVQLQPESLERRLGPLTFFAPVDPPQGSRRELPGAEVLKDRQRRHQSQVLVHEAQTEVGGDADWDRESDRATFDFQFAARVGVVVAGEDLDEGGLPAPVLADEAVDLTPLDAHADLVQRPLAAEGHGHVAQREGLVHGHVVHLCLTRM